MELKGGGMFEKGKAMGLEIDCGSLLLLAGLTCPDNPSGLTNLPEKANIFSSRKGQVGFIQHLSINTLIHKSSPALIVIINKCNKLTWRVCE